MNKWEAIATDAVAKMWDSRGAQRGMTIPAVFENVERCAVGAHPRMDTSEASTTGGAAGAELNAGSLPPEFAKWYRLAGMECEAMPAPVLAAQGFHEGGFQPHEFRDVGNGQQVGGYTQFERATWATYGWKVDEQGRQIPGTQGQGDPNNIADAVMAQARYNCANAEMIQGWIDDGSVQGNITELTLGAYLAGPGAIQQAGGIGNPVADMNGSTPKSYANTIMELSKKYATDMGASAPGGETAPGGSLGEKIISAARQYEGLEYRLGGGDFNGPNDAGQGDGAQTFDCTGLIQRAVFEATGGKVTTPRSTDSYAPSDNLQVVTDPQPGDLVLTPGHAAIFLAPGKVYQASDYGIPLGEGSEVPGGTYYRVVE